MAEDNEASSSSQRNHLPGDFVLTAHECVLGRGKKHAKHPGNIQFKRLIESQKFAYSQATSKKEKTKLLMAILNTQRSNSPGRMGFVRQDSSGRWHAVEDTEARIFIAQSMRDCLNSGYRSCKQFKRSKRKAEKENAIHDNNDCDERGVKENAPLKNGQTTDNCIGSENVVQDDSSHLVFNTLLQAFGADSSLDINPFEPTPLPSRSNEQIKLDESGAFNWTVTTTTFDEFFTISKEDLSVPDYFGSLCGMV